MLSEIKIKQLLERLDEHYGRDIVCYLSHENAWQLLVATILSAQCTDARVNIVTEALFRKYPSLDALAAADITELEEDIRSTGFYHNKAANIKGCAVQLIEKYGGIVPSDIDVLTTLPGVGRKTANVIRGNIYGIPSIVVDTHVKRISKLLGLTEHEEPVKVEYDLMNRIPEEHWILINLQLIAHGRSICKAGRPKCKDCMLADICESNLKKGS